MISKTKLALAMMAIVPAVQAAEPTSELLTMEDLMTMDYEQVDSHTIKSEKNGLSVEIQQGKQAAIEHLLELQAELEILNESNKTAMDSKREGQVISELKETTVLLNEIATLEAMIENDNWQKSASDGSFSNSLCQTTYNLDYEVARAAFNYSLIITASTELNGVGPRPPHARAGSIKAKAIMRPQGPNLVKDTELVQFDDTWFQTHVATASVQSGLHSSNTIIPWKGVAVLTHDFPFCNAFSKIRVWGENSYTSAINITDVTYD